MAELFMTTANQGDHYKWELDYVDKESEAAKYSSREVVRREVKEDSTTVVNNLTTEQNCCYPVHNRSIVAIMHSARL